MSKRNGSTNNSPEGGPSNGARTQSHTTTGGITLITGGAGFIGTNLADRLLSRTSRDVTIFDNLSRSGVEANWAWLRRRHGNRVRLVEGDVRNLPELRPEVQRADSVFHFAAQVAVTTSLTDPIHDFEVNARGTLNLLEAMRAMRRPPRLLFTSTNKVYGALDHVDLRCHGTRYEPTDAEHRAHGVSEATPLSFHSPYGCSKGFADQAVLDYARGFDLPAAVFRMSCIYGLHQCGTEDQGWVAHFVRSALRDCPITVFGDGHQVRDILFADDLIDALLVAESAMDDIAGEAFNIGGGVDHAISLVELLDLIERLRGGEIERTFRDWRPGDQRYYISDIRRFQRITGWWPRTSVEEGVERLMAWFEVDRKHPEPAPVWPASAAIGRGTEGCTLSRDRTSNPIA